MSNNSFWILAPPTPAVRQLGSHIELITWMLSGVDLTIHNHLAVFSFPVTIVVAPCQMVSMKIKEASKTIDDMGDHLLWSRRVT